jgi:hypothetical protein
MSALTRILATLVGLFSTGAQAQQGTTPTPCPATAVRVFLAGDGTISLNGKTIPATDLKAALGALSPRPTEVCYSRGNPKGAPPSNVERVMDDVASLRVPISFYTDATFSRRVVLR